MKTFAAKELKNFSPSLFFQKGGFKVGCQGMSRVRIVLSQKGGRIGEMSGMSRFFLIFISTQPTLDKPNFPHFLPGIKYRDILDILDISKHPRSFCERREENLDMP